LDLLFILFLTLSKGEDGYIYVERGYDFCGVADEATLPIV
jgi:hypothetical protein